MVDFHSHILPGVDDGSRNVDMSLELLRMEQQQGIDTVVLTPHYYASENSPEVFLKRRESAWDRLKPQLTPDHPRILLGAEVQYFEGIGRIEALDSLCMEGTKLLLLEMPFNYWDSRTVDAVLELQDSGRVQVVLAHIDRYLKQPAAAFQNFRRFGIQMQVNTSFFDGFFQRHRAMSMLKKGEFQFIGSDCHNVSSRKPDWSSVPLEAKQVSSENFRVMTQAFSKL